MQKQSEKIAAELEVMRAELQVINENDDATEEELARGEELLKEWDVKKAAHDKAVEREEKVEAVMRASLNAGNREGSGPTVISRSKRDPFAELSRSKTWTDSDFIERAKDAIEQAPEFLDDAGKEAATNLGLSLTVDQGRVAGC
ncbi:hypothetical protein [Micromonospora sp. RV43]|uniref:hypothetical protein n=1 Tax=Micromonospora sp. RV43 TaxID=1661387 RepID=UPI000A4E568A|nr:hypothetical protein [Micromonospora sp. RV43]